MPTVKKIVQKKPTSKEKPKKEVEEEEVETGAEDASGSDEDQEVDPPKLESKGGVEDSDPVEEEEVDYLRKYQFKKVNDKPTQGGRLTDPDPNSKAAIMKAFLLSEKRISILIPLPEGMDSRATYPVTRNGYRLDFPYNTYIDVPMAIAEQIRDSNKQTIAALDQFKYKDPK